MKTILISGGSDGLGKALATRLAKQHTVIILSHNVEKTTSVAEEIGCDYAVADVTNADEIKQAVDLVIKRHKKIDCLINNAGILIQGPLEENETERIKETMDVNATGTILLTHAVLPYMKKVVSGRIINVISQAGLGAKKERAVYNASKWAITGFTKSLYEELTGTGVTITGFYPGPMKTALFAKAGIDMDMSHEMELTDVVRALEFIIESPDRIAIPEFGINSVK